jgi:glycerol-3-phosphate O-acyltransferase / dihydroxyacetone phosphate acyltransferase
MTWLDERLFGWSKSSRRGTSAWGGTAVSSVEASRVGSPDISDDEDHGDYDNVIGYLPSIVGSTLGLTRQPKSLRGSFADLPSVRSRENLAPPKSQPSSPMIMTNPHLSPFVSSDSSGALTHRKASQRERKLSLSDNVAVERIGRIDHDGTFKEATEELNQENEARRKGR